MTTKSIRVLILSQIVATLLLVAVGCVVGRDDYGRWGVFPSNEPPPEKTATSVKPAPSESDPLGLAGTLPAGWQVVDVTVDPITKQQLLSIDMDKDGKTDIKMTPEQLALASPKKPKE